jgi:hypothetical protein
MIEEKEFRWGCGSYSYDHGHGYGFGTNYQVGSGYAQHWRGGGRGGGIGGWGTNMYMPPECCFMDGGLGVGDIHKFAWTLKSVT